MKGGSVMPDLVEGVIIETNGETAKVRCSVHSDCENCGVCPGSDAMIIDVVDTIGAKPGDSVIVESRKSNMVLAAFMVFIFPLLAVGGGIYLGYYLAPRLMISPKLAMTLGGIIFGVMAIYVIKYLDRSLKSENTIVRTIK